MPVLDVRRKRPYRLHREMKAQLVARGLSQVEVARRAGITSQHLNAVLNGYAPMTDRLARDIAFATGIPLKLIQDHGSEETAS